MTRYCLDVAYASDVKTYDNSDIAMAYGFAVLVPNAGWQPQGQAAEKVVTDDSFTFSIFDTASSPGTITQIEIIFLNDNPFGWQENKKTFKGDGVPAYKPNMGSAGCNVTGAWWPLPTYTIATPPDKNATYTFSVKVSVTPAGTNSQKVFYVDPRIIVNGGNP